jgi:hypothetical protein
LISLQGFFGSPEHSAALELRNSNLPDPFSGEQIAIATSQEEYDSLTIEFGHSRRVILVENLDEIPMVYRNYGAYTWEMVEQVRYIAEKYSLTLLGDFIQYDWSDITLQWKISHNSFLSDLITVYPGTLWESGTFLLDGVYDDIHFQIMSNRKGVLDGRLFPIDDIDNYSHWSYKNAYGTPLLLLQSKYHSFIIADTDSAFIVVSIHAGSEVLVNENAHIPKAIDLEHFANLIDFSQLK